ncbi:MAG: glutathione S-transferase family protein [Pseudomonadales bacterium]|nr:glutathione S-transferase family protein [Pseudomonadales bacterium]
MKHYTNPMSRAVTTNWMLAELDVPHEQVTIDFASGQQQSPAYLAINPMGKVPALEDDGVVVTEVAAICAYLADRFPEKQLSPPTNSPKRAAYYRYLFVAGNTLEPLFALQSIGFTHPNALSAGWGDMPRGLATIESMTPDTGWALGDQFTTADVVFGGLLDFSMRFGWMEPSPRVAAYVGRLRARPAYAATHAAFDS